MAIFESIANNVQQDDYEKERQAIMNRQIPMDYGPHSSHEQALKKINDDLADLDRRYGRTPGNSPSWTSHPVRNPMPNNDYFKRRNIGTRTFNPGFQGYVPPGKKISGSYEPPKVFGGTYPSAEQVIDKQQSPQQMDYSKFKSITDLIKPKV